MPTADDFSGSGTTRQTEEAETCEWAALYGEGLHVDIDGEHGPHRFIATCCNVGDISGPLGHPVCGATEGDYGRCNLPRGHGIPNAPMAWHQEKRNGQVWCEWRGPNPDERCRICGALGREH